MTTPTEDGALDGIDLHAWRVPPPTGDGRAIVARALASAVAPPRRTLAWVLVATVVVNAVVATALAIVVPRVLAPAPAAAPVTALPAGGAVDPQVAELMRRLDAERAELERRLAELDELRKLVGELDRRLSRYEQPHPDPVVPPAPDPTPSPDPTPTPTPTPTGCDEVSCLLDVGSAACCARFDKGLHPATPTPTPTAELPETLTREIITRAIAGVRHRVDSCGDKTAAHGLVKIHVRVDGDGAVTQVDVNETPDVALGHCVASAVQTARFAPTQRGGSFSYPFTF